MTSLFLWKQRGYLTVQEAAMLLLEHELPFNDQEYLLNQSIQDQPTDYRALKDLLLNSIYEGELIPSFYFPFSLSDGREIPDEKLTEISLESLAAWYKNRSPNGPWPEIISDCTAITGKTTATSMREQAVSNHPRDTYIFRKSRGGTWHIQVKGETLPIKHYKGLEYIRHLLAHPGQKIHVRKLANLLADKDNLSNELPFAEIHEGYSFTPFKDKVFDDPTKRYINEKIDDLQAEIEVARSTKEPQNVIKKLEYDLEKCKEYLAEGTSPNSETKTFNDETDKIRKAVSKTIKDALKKLEDEQLDELNKHLALIKLGVYCVYEHPDPPTWIID